MPAFVWILALHGVVFLLLAWGESRRKRHAD